MHNNNDESIEDNGNGGPATGGQAGDLPRTPSRPFPNTNRQAVLLPLLQAKLAAAPRDIPLLKAVANASAQAGHWDESLKCARRILAQGPDPEAFEYLVDALFRLGRRNDLDALLPDMIAASRHYTRAIAGLHLLKSGRYVEGFALRHAGLSGQRTRKHEVCRDESIAWWDGTAFNGKLLVVVEQALGEEILLSSTFTDLAARGQRAVIECDPRLAPLYQRSFPSLAFVPRVPGALHAAAEPGCRKTTSSELNYLLRSDDAFTSPAHWLVPDTDKVRMFREDYLARWPGKRCIGLSWRSYRAVWGERLKSIRLDGLGNILRAPATAFVCVQYGAVADDIAAAAAANLPVPWIDPRVDTMMDLDLLAAQLSALDLVITTSNTTAHLAGALGVPCWVMLPWRSAVFSYWGYEGERTPWYPAMRLWRSTHDGDWQELDARIRYALDAMNVQDPQP